MKETSKAMQRRWAEHDAGGPIPWRDFFKGEGLDVGSGDDPLTCAQPFDLPDGGGDDLRKFFIPGTEFDWIHGSQVLEHALDPVVMLRSWIELLRPKGYIIATVPDFELYEHCIFPSKWNAGHRSTWSMTIWDARDRSSSEFMAGHLRYIHCKLPEWLRQFGLDIICCRLINRNYDYSLGPDVDQTLDPEKQCECFIEFVLRKP